MKSGNFFKNDAAVAISLGFIIMFAITVIVFVGLIISFFSLSQYLEKSAMTENFKIIGSGFASKITTVDTIVNITNSYGGTVNMLEFEFSFPASVAGKTYTINISNSPYEMLFAADNGASGISLFNTSTKFTAVVLDSASEDFVIKYNQSGGGSLYIVEQ